MHVPVFPRIMRALCHSNCVTSRGTRIVERRPCIYMYIIQIRIGRYRKQRRVRYDLYCMPYSILERLEFYARVRVRMS